MTPGAPASPVVRRLDVPASVLRHLAATCPERYPALLDSVAEGPLGRMSVLAAYPRAALWINPSNTLHDTGFTPRGRGFLDALEHWWLSERVPAGMQELPFAGGWIVFLGYELGQEIEPRL